MDNATRLQYLEAMGIDVWVPRHEFVADLPAGGGLSESVECSDDRMDAGVITSGAQGAMHGAIPDQSETHQDDSSKSHEHSSADHAWHNLQQAVSVCRACQLCETRTQTVFGVGSHRASWMLIGEAPGQNEDLQGEPFVGKAGQLLNEMLRAIGLARDEVFIANILKCRPPNNRDPQADEVAACHGFLQQQITLLQPKIILAVGRIAAQNLLNSQQPLAKLRGRLHRLENIPLVVVHHPAYLLRTLTEKAKAWDDLQFALSVYQSLQEK
jgi:uracil-DNA glycosylase